MKDCGEKVTYGLQDVEKKDELIILNCFPQKKISAERKQKILEIARTMFEEDFDENH